MNKDGSYTRETLTVDDLKDSKLEIIRHCQRKRFHKKINSLKNGEPIKRSSHLYKLNLVLQDGTQRVGGRLNCAAMPEESKDPAISAKDLRVSELILQEVHKEVDHSGCNHVVSKLRLKYWILNVSTVVRKVLSKYVVCRWLHGVTGQQQMADLPRNRLLPDEPHFSRTGVDFFGPFEVKRGRVTMKRYCVIFTCLAIRAVHLEVAASLDTDSFIHALRRFIARRGQVLDLPWVREYLPELQMRQKWSSNFVPGDIVLLVDETALRNSWVIGKVIEAVLDKHGLVRRVRLKTKTSELVRPITKVCLLVEAV